MWDDRDEYLSDPYDKKKIEESKAATKLLRRRAKSQVKNFYHRIIFPKFKFFLTDLYLFIYSLETF